MKKKKKTPEEELLEKFMKEHFDLKSLEKAGFFTKDMRGNYQAYADRICKHFGYKTIYEYGSKEIRCHLTYVDGHRPLSISQKGKLEEEPFVTVIKNIYE